MTGFDGHAIDRPSVRLWRGSADSGRSLRGRGTGEIDQKLPLAARETAAARDPKPVGVGLNDVWDAAARSVRDHQHKIVAVRGR
jgi:hypothetical protein